MKLCRILVWILVSMLGGWSLAHGQAIDPSPASATIGRPLDLRLLVRPAPDMGGARFDRRCIQAQARIGDHRVPNNAWQVEIGQVDEDGLYGVRLRHAQLVDEPVVQLQINMICGAIYQREFDILATPGPASSPVPPSDAGRRNTRASQGHRSAEIIPASPTQPQSPQGAQFAPRPAESHAGRIETAAASIETTLAAAPPGSGSADPQAMLRSIMKLLQTTNGVDSRSTLAGSDYRFDPVSARETADNHYLLQELGRLRQEQQQAATAITSLHARLTRAETDRWTQSVWVASATLAALLAFGLLMRTGDALVTGITARLKRRREAGEASHLSNPGSVPRPAAPALQPHVRLEPVSPWARQPAPQPPTALQPGTVAETADIIEFDVAPAGSSRQVTPSTSVPAARLPSTWVSGADTTWPGLADPAAPPAPRTAESTGKNRWAHASFGPVSLDHHLVTPVRDGVKAAIEGGYLGFAATMLEKTLYAGAGKHPWLLMQLLEVYERLNQPENLERVSAEIEALYSVQTPSTPTPGVPPDTTSLTAEGGLELCETWPALRATWADPEAAAFIANLLVKQDKGPRYNLPTFSDLLFLHELAQIREGMLDTAQETTSH
jgi:hypothetical protein